MKKLRDTKISRRRLLGGAAATTAALPVVHSLVPHRGLHEALAAGGGHHGHEGHDSAAHRGSGHLGAMGSVDPRVNGFDPHELLRDFDGGQVKREGGRTVREFELTASDVELEVAPGVKFAGWAYNRRVPGPTLRAREGDRMRVHFHEMGLLEELRYRLHHPAALLIVLPNGLVKLINALPFVCGDLRRQSLAEIWAHFQAAWQDPRVAQFVDDLARDPHKIASLHRWVYL